MNWDGGAESGRGLRPAESGRGLRPPPESGRGFRTAPESGRGFRAGLGGTEFPDDREGAGETEMVDGAGLDAENAGDGLGAGELRAEGEAFG